MFDFLSNYKPKTRPVPAIILTPEDIVEVSQDVKDFVEEMKMFDILSAYIPKTRPVFAIKLTPENIWRVSRKLNSEIVYIDVYGSVHARGEVLSTSRDTFNHFLIYDPDNLHLVVKDINGSDEYVKMGNFLLWSSEMGFGSMSEEEFLDKFELNARGDIFD